MATSQVEARVVPGPALELRLNCRFVGLEESTGGRIMLCVHCDVSEGKKEARRATHKGMQPGTAESRRCCPLYKGSGYVYGAAVRVESEHTMNSRASGHEKS